VRSDLFGQELQVARLGHAAAMAGKGLTIEARDDMKMQVKHRLASRRTVELGDD
jgi:hypothetical protein